MKLDTPLSSNAQITEKTQKARIITSVHSQHTIRLTQSAFPHFNK